MTDETPDYTTMSGAEFRRTVGADPERWAMAFQQTMASYDAPPSRAVVASWFRDAMDAAVRAATRRMDGE